MAYSDRLYKYLPATYANSVLRKGQLLFRNFTYFRQTEGKTRGDYLEAHHRDNPDNDITVTNVTTGKSIKGDFSFLNSTNSDVIFMFCLSLLHHRSLYIEFESDACIEILDPGEFIRRARLTVMRLASRHKKGLLNGPVRYYAPNKPSKKNIKDATVLPFLKDEIYSHQSEYRLVYGTRKAFELRQQIVTNAGYDFRLEAKKGTVKEKLLIIGSIEDITTLHHGI